MNSFLEQVNLNSGKLLKLYLEQKPYITLKRGLGEIVKFEIQSLKELKLLYQDELNDIKFLHPKYFTDFSRFHRFQDIPERYFIKGCSNFYFISHRWETLHDPDPTKRQFIIFKKFNETILSRNPENQGFWYDYSCMPQKDLDNKFTENEEKEFLKILKVMHLLAAFSCTACIYCKDYMFRSWCCAELIIATRIAPLITEKDQIFPFSNAIRFRHLAFVILFLSVDNELKTRMLQMDDMVAMGFLNSLLFQIVQGTKSTVDGDKDLLFHMLHRHFWYHVRALGFRNQLMQGFSTLEQFDSEYIEDLFKQFLIYSNDESLEWTKKVLAVIETMVIQNNDDFKEFKFQKHEITPFEFEKNSEGGYNFRYLAIPK